MKLVEASLLGQEQVTQREAGERGARSNDHRTVKIAENEVTESLTWRRRGRPSLLLLPRAPGRGRRGRLLQTGRVPDGRQSRSGRSLWGGREAPSFGDSSGKTQRQLQRRFSEERARGLSRRGLGRGDERREAARWWRAAAGGRRGPRQQGVTGGARRRHLSSEFQSAPLLVR